ncbi:hypothetical protein BGZ63DRAFT_229855 [Mariannaea sp. PMI_226]|nr:hypothetical protein BGZ63DRAFT_229855 [Mariannaea sp. PMI_226]
MYQLQRRIKCDEVRPSCTQCVRSKKACTGYPPPPRSARPFEEIRIAPRPVLASTQATPIGASPFQRNDVVLPPRRIRQKIIPQSVAALVPSPTAYQPTANLQLLPMEGPYFEIFRSHTVNELSGYFDNEFWSRRVLQECHSQPAIKYAVIALGALYQTLEQTPEPGIQSTSSLNPHARAVMGHWQIAVKRYSDACNALVEMNSQDKMSHTTLIMANVLLACFDSFIGDHRQAIKQIQNGLGLLERLRSQQKDQEPSKCCSTSQDDTVEDVLVTMFTRLAIQAKSYDMAFHFPQPYVIRLNSPQRATTPPDSTSTPSSSGMGSPPALEPLNLPEEFTSLLEARAACDKLNESIMRYLEELYSTVNPESKKTLPKAWRDYGLNFKHLNENWSDAYDHLFQSRHDPSVPAREQAAIASLKMLQTNCQVLYLMMFSDKELDFDNYLPQFQLIVDLAAEVVANEERRAAAQRCPDSTQCTHRDQLHSNDVADAFSGPGYSAPHIKPRFAADLGIVPPLFVVATKCRDPITRRQAIRILQSSPRREGMWDSAMISRIATWVMNLEESAVLAAEPKSGVACGNKRVPQVIPDEKRVMIQSVDFDLRNRVADIQVGSRGIRPGETDPKWSQARVSW